MVGRFFALIAGMIGAAVASQGPGFTLQYMQNLNGRIDELRPIVEKFDADIAAYGFSRSQAMVECATAEGLLDALCNTYETVIVRFEDLTAHYTELSSADDYRRPLILAKIQKREIVEAVMEEFETALPITGHGFVYAGGGFALLWGGFSFLVGLFGGLFGRRH